MQSAPLLLLLLLAAHCLLGCLHRSARAQLAPPQQAALNSLFSSTEGPSWFNASGWSTNSTGCDAFGVSCDAAGRNVLAIELVKNNLRGAIPGSVCRDLVALKTLSLARNYIVGPLAPFASTSLTAFNMSGNSLAVPASSVADALAPASATLEILAVSDCSLYGELDAGALEPFGALQVLDLSLNNIAGTLPPLAAAAAGLRVLNLGTNSFVADELPASWAGMANLTDLVLFRNFVGGLLPPWLGLLRSLESFDYTLTLLGGPLPASLANLTALESWQGGFTFTTGPLPDLSMARDTLQVFSCPSCLLTGTIPPAWSQLTQLRSLILSSNSLSGTIPDIFGAMTQLEVVILEKNALLTGRLPPSLTVQPHLRWLCVQWCALTGELASVYGSWQLPALEYLNLEGNALSGSIPSALAAGIGNVRIINLSFNNFSGTLPANMGELQYVETVILAQNQLHGSLQPVFGPMLLVLDVSFNSFTSLPPAINDTSQVLAYLNLANNLLSGELDAGITKLLFLDTLDISNNANVTGLRCHTDRDELCFASMILRAVAMSNTSISRLPRLFQLDENCNYAESKVEVLDASHTPLMPRFLPALAWEDVAAQVTVGGAVALGRCYGLDISLVTTNIIFWPQNDNLVALLLNGVGLYGDLPGLLRSLPALYVADLSNNKLASGVDDVPQTLLYGDFSSNALAGFLDRSLQVNTNLDVIRSLDLRNNSGLQALPAGTLPSFLLVESTIDTSAVPANSTYNCPLISMYPGAPISLDPSYYSFSFCWCAETYLGIIAPDGSFSGCQPASKLCLAASGTSCYVSARNRSVAVAPGYWPSPDPETLVTRLLPCAAFNNMGLQTCNTDGSVTCTLVGNASSNALRCAGSLCLTGYTDRLCSKCASGYFSRSSACLVCPAHYRMLLASAPLGLALVLCIATALLITMRDTSRRIRDDEINYQTVVLGRAMPCRAAWARYWPELTLVLSEMLCLGSLALLGVMPVGELLLIGLLLVLFTAIFFAGRYPAVWRDDADGAVGSGAGSARAQAASGIDVYATAPLLARESWVLDVKCYMRVTVVHLQTLGAVLAWTPIPPGSALALLSHLAARVDLHMAGLECLFGDALDAFALRVVTVLAFGPVLVVLIGAGFGLAQALMRCSASGGNDDEVDSEDAHAEASQALLGPVKPSHTGSRAQAALSLEHARTARLWQRLQSLLLYVGFVCFFPIIETSLLTMQCVPVPETHDLAYLGAAPWIRCGSHEQVVLALVGVLAICATLGLAGVVAWHLLGEVRAARRVGELSKGFGSPMRFLVDPYRAQAWWFEALLSVRRFVVAALFAFLLPTQPLSVLLICLAFFCQLVTTSACWPFRVSAANVLDQMFSGVGMLTALGVALMAIASQVTSTTGALVLAPAIDFVVLLNCMAICGLAVLVAMPMLRCMVRRLRR